MRRPPFWYRLPIRKPLTVVIVLYTLVVVSRYVWGGGEMPQNIMYLLAALNGVSIPSYYGSSAYESRFGDNHAGMWDADGSGCDVAEPYGGECCDVAAREN